MKSFNQAKEGLRWRVGDGNNISLWCDHWVGSGPLFLEKSVSIDVDQLELKVADILDNNWNWNLSVLKSGLPKHIADAITSMPVGSNRGVEDRLVWHNAADGNLTAKGVYKFLTIEEVWRRVALTSGGGYGNSLAHSVSACSCGFVCMVGSESGHVGASLILTYAHGLQLMWKQICMCFGTAMKLKFFGNPTFQTICMISVSL